MKCAMAQINPTVGAMEANVRVMLEWAAAAADRGADLIVFPELAMTGYPPQDLLEKRDFIDRNLSCLQDLAQISHRIAVIVGHVDRSGLTAGRGLYNSVSLLREGKRAATGHKILLPTYDVFDEDRYFDPGERPCWVDLCGERLGLTVCEDIWNPDFLGQEKRYHQDPVRELALERIDRLINISASPYCRGRPFSRLEMLQGVARRYQLPMIYVNQVGGNDELIFDGTSVALDQAGNVLRLGTSFEECCCDIDTHDSRLEEEFGEAAGREIDEMEEVSKALVLGLRDYARKCGFTDVVLGLSGGIDSAVVCALAAEALGPEHVWGIAMPSEYSTGHSLEDAEALARNLGIRYDVIPIHQGFNAFRQMLRPVFEGRPEDLAEENIQARVRGVILMGVSNKFGRLVLTTGNKSELAVGYCTLYGDMSGGLAVISDLLKTEVYRLARSINRDREIIPNRVLTKPPSAELRPDQKDEDSLPAYEVLDPILRGYVEEYLSPSELIRSGFDEATVRRVVGLVDRNEYKRKQAAPGLRVTNKAFGMGRRIPIVQRFEPR
ncbi:MAG: NAD+ synthase [Verrucomicrobiota bacterium]|jgi:NAD+ synthase (glutamine-hydrolysing)|nr:NAD+ synthase [Verrucomicrobiota bacterium]MDD8049887.1 NAD+ synthase [Verrucomicrobiota bacterium]